MVIQESLLTVEQFMQRLKHDSLREELLNGEVLQMPPSSTRNSEIAGFIASVLIVFVRKHKLGRVSGADGGYQLDEHTVLAPSHRPAACPTHRRSIGKSPLTLPLK